MGVMSSGDESDTEPMYTEMLEDICDSSQSHPRVNVRDTRYTIFYLYKQIQEEWKVASLSMQNMGKDLHKVFKAVVDEVHKF